MQQLSTISGYKSSTYAYMASQTYIISSRAVATRVQARSIRDYPQQKQCTGALFKCPIVIPIQIHLKHQNVNDFILHSVKTCAKYAPTSDSCHLSQTRHTSIPATHVDASSWVELKKIDEATCPGNFKEIEITAKNISQWVEKLFLWAWLRSMVTLEIESNISNMGRTTAYV